MTKIVKMSLAAAVAVAGLNSTASAANLAEWAQQTTLSGYVRYRINHDHETTKKGDATEEAKAVMKFTTPVNDAVTANLKYVSQAVTKSSEVTADTGVKEANFVVSLGDATVIAGLQTSQSPFFANNGDTRSHGVTALIPAGPVTIAGAYYTTTVLSSDRSASINPALGALANNVLALGALGDFGGVKANLWYASVEDGADVEDQALTPVGLIDASATSIQVVVPVGPVTIDAMHTVLENNSVEGTLSKLVVAGSAGVVDYAVGYAQTGDEALGGQVTLDNESDAASDLAMEILNMQAVKDASAFYASVGGNVADKVSLGLAILSGDEGNKGTNKDFDETDVSVKYDMSKNFYVKAWYATGDNRGSDFKNSRIEVKYSF